MPSIAPKLKELNYDLKAFPMPTAIDIQKAEIAALTCKGDKDFAEFLEIDLLTLKVWCKKSKAFYNAVNTWKDNATNQIEVALAKKAIGFTKKTRRDVITKAGTIETLTIETYYPPDTAAANMWLTNRDPENWKDKKEIDVNVVGNIRAWLVSAEAAAPSLLDVTPRDEALTDAKPTQFTLEAEYTVLEPVTPVDEPRGLDANCVPLQPAPAAKPGDLFG